jgi:hypothetical protein
LARVRLFHVLNLEVPDIFISNVLYRA